MTLEEKIRQAIVSSPLTGSIVRADAPAEAVPCITFHTYMASCLYDEACGYYRSGPVRIGRAGDFYTSAAIGSIMAEATVAAVRRWIRDTQAESDQSRLHLPLLAEWGGGVGVFMRQFLDAWMNGLQAAALPPFERIVFIEDHPAHAAAARQQLQDSSAGAALAQEQLQLLNSTEALQLNWKEGPVVLLANELLDAFPVHRITRSGGQLCELGVTVAAAEVEAAGQAREKGTAAFCYCAMPLSDPALEKLLLRDQIEVREGQVVEVGLAAEVWFRDMLSRIGSGLVVLIDYGDSAEELTASHRMHGTLLAYYRHRASDSPFDAPGEQDLTAHVNFTGCRKIAAEAGWQERFYGTQKQFLLEGGILDMLVQPEGQDPFSPAFRRNRAIRQLLLSDQMSELFKVLMLEKRSR